MSTLESLGTVLATDILVVGGGIGGLVAAITAKEESPQTSVLIVEKATTGWAGKASKGGGWMSYVTAQDDPEEFVKFRVQHVGCYLEDQELLREYAYTCEEAIQHLGRMGVPLAQNADGSLKYIRHLSDKIPWGGTAIDLDMCLKLRKTALKQGTRVLDKVSIVDLLQDGDRVVGAIGFSLLDGTCFLIKAKATLLANGSQNFRIMPMWSCGRGDGIAAAYRAGAEMRNAEMGSFINMIYKANRLVTARVEKNLYNAGGEHISKKYFPNPEMESDISIQIPIGWYQEVMAGRGPVYVANGDGSPWEPFGRTNGQEFNRKVKLRPVHAAMNDRLWGRGRQAFQGMDMTRLEVVPGLIGEMSPVRVDHQMATTLPGLFALGDVCYNGSAMLGAVPCPPGRMRGSGLTFAAFSGRKAGPSAAKYVAGLEAEPKVDEAQARELQEQMFAPLHREGGVAPIELVHAVQEAMSPVKYSQLRSEERMKEALGMVLEVRARLPELKAKDPHHLAACNEARSMATCAEMFFRASLVRKESRGWFVREDYPAMDNQNWLKWILLKNQKGEMAISTEDIPIQRYPVQP